MRHLKSEQFYNVIPETSIRVQHLTRHGSYGSMFHVAQWTVTLWNGWIFSRSTLSPLTDMHVGNCHTRGRSREVSEERHHLKAASLSYPQQSKMNSIIKSLTALFFIISQLQLCSGFVQIRTRALMKPIAAFDFNSIIVTAIEVAEKADDYQYGAVAAPGWALPLGAVLVIATAAIPVLLKPGEEV